MAKQKSLVLTQGEILRILVIRSRRKAPDVAAALGLATYTYLSRLYLMERLPKTIVPAACTAFDVHPDIFESKTLEELSSGLDSLKRRVGLLEIEKSHLETKIALLSARLEECERKKGILENSRN